MFSHFGIPRATETYRTCHWGRILGFNATFSMETAWAYPGLIENYAFWDGSWENATRLYSRLPLRTDWKITRLIFLHKTYKNETGLSKADYALLPPQSSGRFNHPKSGKPYCPNNKGFKYFFFVTTYNCNWLPFYYANDLMADSCDFIVSDMMWPAKKTGNLPALSYKKINRKWFLVPYGMSVRTVLWRVHLRKV